MPREAADDTAAIAALVKNPLYHGSLDARRRTTCAVSPGAMLKLWVTALHTASIVHELDDIRAGRYAGNTNRPSSSPRVVMRMRPVSSSRSLSLAAGTAGRCR